MEKKIDCGCEKDVFACRIHAHTKPAHTPTPWEVYGTQIKAKNNLAVCDMFQTGIEGAAQANAAFIVRAVNNYDALVEALNDLINQASGNKKLCGHQFDCICAFDRAEKVLSATERE